MNNPEFKVHRLNDNGVARAQSIAFDFDCLLENLKTVIPAGRELSIVKTKLEEACFFAKKGIANDPQNQLPVASY